MSDDAASSKQKLVDSEGDPALKEWNKHEEETRTEEMRLQLEMLTGGPRKTCLHRTFSFFSFWMGIAGVLMLLGQLVGVYFYEGDPVQGVMRCYVVLMCVLIVLNELQWTKFIRESAILRIWITRGIFYAFVGVLGLEENDTQNASEHKSATGRAQALEFIDIVAYLMIGCGISYFVMGCLCLQLLRNRVLTDYEQRVKEAKVNRQKVASHESLV